MLKEIYFSCIITCYNRETLIHNAIESILNQSYTNFEIIVIDDCSTDKSVEVINRYTNSKVKLYSHQTNQGQNAALNSGIAHAQYEYLAFLDSDDVWEKDYLLEMRNAYNSNPTIAFAYCNLVNGPSWVLDGPNQYPAVLNQGYLSSMITITAKKDAVIKVGSFDLKYKICQDDDFCFRLSKQFSFKLINKKLARIGGAENSMTRNLVEVAYGWAFLFKCYKADIESFCGAKSYARHMFQVSTLFFGCGQYIKGLQFYLNGILFFFKPSNNKFEFKMKEFWNTNLKVVKTLLLNLKARFKSAS